MFLLAFPTTLPHTHNALILINISWLQLFPYNTPQTSSIKIRIYFQIILPYPRVPLINFNIKKTLLLKLLEFGKNEKKIRREKKWVRKRIANQILSIIFLDFLQQKSALKFNSGKLSTHSFQIKRMFKN